MADGFLALVVLFAGSLLPQEPAKEVEAARERWEEMPVERRQVLLERYEKLQELSPKERRLLLERLDELQSGALSVEVRQGGPAIQEPVRAVSAGPSQGSQPASGLEPSLPPTLAPAAKARVRIAYWTHVRVAMTRQTLETLGSDLGYPRETIDTWKALPLAKQDRRLFRLGREHVMRSLSGQVPSGLTEKEWRRMQAMSDLEFLEQWLQLPSAADHRLPFASGLPDDQAFRELREFLGFLTHTPAPAPVRQEPAPPELASPHAERMPTPEVERPGVARAEPARGRLRLERPQPS